MKLNALTLKDVTYDPAGLFEDIRDEVREWRDALKDALEKACETTEDGYLDNVELEKEGVIYEASAFDDDEVKPIIKFINQFFNLEDDD